MSILNEVENDRIATPMYIADEGLVDPRKAKLGKKRYSLTVDEQGNVLRAEAAPGGSSGRQILNEGA